MIKPPALFGHELAGVIEENGSGVNGGVRNGHARLAGEFRALQCLFFLPQGPAESLRGFAVQ